MKFHAVLAAAATLAAVFASAPAAATTITFTEPEFVGNLVNASNEYAAYGVTFQSSYYYVDGRDTFDTRGIANGPSDFSSDIGRIDFTAPVSSVGFQWVNFAGANSSVTVSAYDSANMLLSSFTSVSGADVGTSSLSGATIAYLLFSSSFGAGYAGISSLRFDAAEVPLPGAALLFLAGAAALRLRRRQAAH